MRGRLLAVVTIGAVSLLAVGTPAVPAKPWTIGVSYQNLACPYVAALQKAAQNACKALGTTCVEADAVNDTAKELKNVESMLATAIGRIALKPASPRSTS